MIMKNQDDSKTEEKVDEYTKIDMFTKILGLICKYIER